MARTITPPYIFCDSTESMSDAVPTLSQSNYLILDCEGQSIGCIGGHLSLLCIGLPKDSFLWLLSRDMHISITIFIVSWECSNALKIIVLEQVSRRTVVVEPPGTLTDTGYSGVY